MRQTPPSASFEVDIDGDQVASLHARAVLRAS